MNLSGVGVWSGELRFLRDGARARDAAAELEGLGYSALWLPGGTGSGRPLFEVIESLLAGTKTVTVATGVMSIWTMSAVDAAARHHALTEAYSGRFALGLGVSHLPFLTGEDRAAMRRPLSAMRSYLDQLDAAPVPVPPSQRLLAALRPKMLELAATRSLGTHPYFSPVEHTATVREQLGPGPLVAPNQAVVLERDPDRARQIARDYMAVYLSLPNYTENLRRFGFNDNDLAMGGSDRLVDAIVAWGDEATVAERLQAHQDVGADHVTVLVLSGTKGTLPHEAWRRIAEATIRA